MQHSLPYSRSWRIPVADAFADSGRALAVQPMGAEAARRNRAVAVSGFAFGPRSFRAARRSANRSVAALQKAIRACLDIHNEQPKPFRWTKSTDESTASVTSVLKLINRTAH